VLAGGCCCRCSLCFALPRKVLHTHTTVNKYPIYQKQRSKEIDESNAIMTVVVGGGGGTNPFDDPFEESKVSTNPFEDDEEQGGDNDGPATTSSAVSADHDDDDSDDDDDDAATKDTGVVSAGLGGAGSGDPASEMAPPAEASWQYLGDLPYRRVPIYSNVQWHRWGSDGGGQSTSRRSPSDKDAFVRHGLASYPPAALQQQRHGGGSSGGILNPREVRALLGTSTTTKVVGCPHGGPIAAMTVPVTSEAGGFVRNTELRILTNSGTPLATIDFPPAEFSVSSGGSSGKRSASTPSYSPADVLEIGYTSRTTLIAVLKDSLCLTYNLRGEYVLYPFYILPRGENQGLDLQQASGTCSRYIRNIYSQEHIVRRSELTMSLSIFPPL